MLVCTAILSSFVLYYVHAGVASSAIKSNYCVPHNARGEPSECWPKFREWEELRNNLTGTLKPLYISDYNECVKQGTDPIKILRTGSGICMQYHSCSKKFCNPAQKWNIPAYSIEAHNTEDIQTALAFADKHDIAVTVKTTGHSFSGSSTGYGSLLIWMHKFQKYGYIVSLRDSCNITYSSTLRLGGGQVWREGYEAVGDKYHIAGGICLSVSAAGGYLMGGGISILSRNLGMGVDNVLRFEVVLPDGRHVFADKCFNSDLFWALRGGGGGTFGVVTSVHYKLHPVSNIIYSDFAIAAPPSADIIDSWLQFWIEKSPNMDKRWGGAWLTTFHQLYFQGSMEDAKVTFLDEFETWKQSLPIEQLSCINHTVSSHKSLYSQKGGANATLYPTGRKERNIGSRLVPIDFVLNNPEKTMKILKFLSQNGEYWNYFLGGAMMDVSENETAVHPAYRKAIWQFETSEKSLQFLRDSIKDTGAGYNHASKSEPNWEDAFWGKNLNRLKELKSKFDPKNRFNCWHCLGYQ